MSTLKDTAQKAMQTALRLTPDKWLPGGRPDPLMHKHGLIGAPITRVDGALKVQGKARFSAEVAIVGLTYAALVHSTIARGRIARIEHRARRKGARRRVGDDLQERSADEGARASSASSPSAAGASSLPIMQDASIHWNGQPVALVLAETQEQADHAASLIEVTYEAEPAVTSFELARPSRIRPNHPRRTAPNSRSAMPRRRSPMPL